jgi:hypothetical protein
MRPRGANCKPRLALRSVELGSPAKRVDNRFNYLERQLPVAHGASSIAGGFPLLPTLDASHWTVALAAPTPELFVRVRVHFEGRSRTRPTAPNRAPLR